MTTQILSPIELGAASKVGGRIWRKQILPVGTINYKGRKINFTPAKLRAIEAAYYDKAFDAVPLVFADGENRHTMHPLAATGEVIGMEFTGKGLDLFTRPDEQADKLLEKYPNIGISGRILENYTRADGKHYDAAIQHALITWDPRITGMKPWEVVNLSVEVEETLDLTQESFAPPGERERIEMADQPLTENEVGQLRSLLALLQKNQEPEATEADPGAVEPEESEQDAQGATEPETDGDEDDLSDEEMEKLLNQILAEEGSTSTEENVAPVGQPEADTETAEPEPIAASNDDVPAVELANNRVAEMEAQLANMQRELNERNYVAERDRLAHAGIPPAVTDLARPLLEGSNVIDLSNGSSVDAGKVMRDVLTAIGKQFKLLDLSGSVGSAFETDKDQAETTERNQFLDRLYDVHPELRS